MSNIAQYPVAIAALMFIIKFLYENIKDLRRDKDNKVDRNGMSENFKNEFYTMVRSVNDIHDWMSKEDKDGRKLIYVPTSHEENIEKFSDLLHVNNNVLKGVQQSMDGLIKVIERIEAS